jgi:hypothetical protein
VDTGSLATAPSVEELRQLDVILAPVKVRMREELRKQRAAKGVVDLFDALKSALSAGSGAKGSSTP